MQKLSLIIFISIILASCKTRITVDEICSVKSIIDGEYVNYSQVLYLAKDNDTTNMELDTMYFRVDKKTQNKFKLENRLEYETNSLDEKFDVERYVYLKPSNDHEAAWHSTLILHKIPKYTERIKCICRKDMDEKLFETIKTQLIKKGYQIDREAGSKFDGEFKDVFIKFQKDNKLPYGKIDLRTLNSLGIKVVER
ncbi:MAG: hypothetical protein NXI23_16400 [Bacteroidetes bacterium]|jgi:hypothetical protein|nr:hypothetical protein [Bacteroidota bacterium]MDF1863508.1 hypothetical protein [Saprospiraceae bacterium]